ncbi:MAG TPA: ATP synthase F0 subunit B [Candidatus Acidoferrales bacterium]|nr:ATP synthase F0 subunit B [Candidatus Acidoferrales bacterium]
MAILQQLGWLFLKSVPTIIVFLLFYWFLRANFFKPLERTLAERNARITKARAEAEAVQAAAKEKVHSYEDALRKARAGVFAEQETSRQAAVDERAKLLTSVRKLEQKAVRKEKERIAREFDAARAQLEGESPKLAGQIVKMILERPAAPLAGARP